MGSGPRSLRAPSWERSSRATPAAVTSSALSRTRPSARTGQLTRLFLEECARVGPVAPDTDILARGDPAPPGARGLDRDDGAAAATVRLQALRVRSHQAGPHSILHDLGDDIAGLYSLAGGADPDAANPLWPVLLRYAELLGWTAQEIGHDAISLRWTTAMADWALKLGDSDALGYALIRRSQRARRRGDPEAAVALARRAGAVGGISPRLAQFAAQREAQACALAGDGRPTTGPSTSFTPSPPRRPRQPSSAPLPALVGARTGPGVRALTAARGNLPGRPRRLPHRDNAL